MAERRQDDRDGRLPGDRGARVGQDRATTRHRRCGAVGQLGAAGWVNTRAPLKGSAQLFEPISRKLGEHRRERRLLRRSHRIDEPFLGTAVGHRELEAFDDAGELVAREKFEHITLLDHEKKRDYAPLRR